MAAEGEVWSMEERPAKGHQEDTMGALGNAGEEDHHLAYCGKDSGEGEMVLGGKWRSEELVELRHQALVHLSWGDEVL